MLSRASLPPLSTMAFPLFTASDAICTSASGRLSKINAMRPIGQLILRSSRPSSRRRASRTFPTGSGISRRSRIPDSTSCSFFSSKRRRFKSGGAKPSARAFSMSFRLASNIASRWDSSCCAICSSAAFLISVLTESSEEAACAARSSLSCIFMHRTI